VTLGAASRNSRMTALLFDGNRADEVEWTGVLPRIGRSALLWIDLESPTEDEVAELVAALDLNSECASAILDDHSEPALGDHGDYLHVRALGISDPHERQLVAVDCIVSKRWVVTARDDAVEVVEQFRERAEGSGSVGHIDGLGFLANLMEWALTSYLEAFEALEADLEEIDAEAMSGRVASADQALADLVDMRREVGRLRRALVSHREVVLALTRPELEAIGTSDSAERFAVLRGRLEDAVQASRDSRDSIVGSFDVLQASTTRRTNEIMKVLTLASVLLLPGALLAGIMGMNFKVGLFETAAYFWVVIGVIVAVAMATVGVARAREWI
jgi:magnesium transporter